MSTTRQAILDAARAAFAEDGYKGATIRGIAARAGVDPSLVMQFFGSKEGVFTAAMELPFDAEAVIASVLVGPKGRLGERLVRQFLTLWQDPETGPQLVGLLRSAAAYPQAATRLAELIGSQVLAPIAVALEVPDAELRAQLAASQLVGLGFIRYVLRLDPLASVDVETLVALAGPTVQRYLRVA